MKALSKLDKIFFYSDPHYGHTNVLKFCPRGYDNINQMHKDYIKLYNKTIPKDGVCIWVGDCFFFGKEKSREIMQQLNGTKVLVRGNHDNKHAYMYSLGFDFVVDYLELHIAGQSVKVKHYPPKYTNNRLIQWFKFNILKHKKPRYFDRYPSKDGRWLIHGHTHSDEKVNAKHKSIHVGVDAWSGTPVSLRQIEKILQKGSV